MPEQEAVSPHPVRVAAETVLRRPHAGEMLWRCGQVPPLSAPRVAVVGSRRALPEQVAMAAALGVALARAGAVVVSGGAEGVDIAALLAATEAGGVAVAVPGGGLNHPHPRSHEASYRALVDRGGALISPFTPTEPARQHHFLQRNALMARMVDALIAVCAEVRSGTLHCVAQAWQADLPVLTVPWALDTPNSSGTQALLAAGARAIWDEVGCQTLVATLLGGRGNTLLRRADHAPGRGPRGPMAAALPWAGDAGVIDAMRGARQCYPPEAVSPGTTRMAPVGCDPVLSAGLAAVLAQAWPVGLTIEELAVASGADRGAVATLVMQLVLAGWLQRAPGGLFTRRG